MKFICTQQNLIRGLSIAEKIIGKNFSLPILQNFLVSSEKNKGLVKVTATDLEMGVEVLIPAKIEEEGDITAPAKLLVEFVRNLPSENIEFSEKNKKITISCKNYKANIKGAGVKDFPIIPIKKTTSPTLEIKKEDFFKGLSSVIGSVSLLEGKPEISGVFVSFRKGEVCFAATDSFRLSEKVVSTPKSYEEKVILPKKACDIIMRILQDNEQPLNIQINDNQITIRSEKINFVSRVIDGEYPNYEQIIPNKFSTEIILLKEEFIKHIKTAALFSNKINEVVLHINSKKQCIEVSSADQEYGDHHSILPCEIKGGDEIITFNYQYLLDGIQNIQSPEIKIKLNQATTPVLITAQEDDGFKYVLMPIKA